MAAYRHNWINTDVRYRKALVFIIKRSQKPIYLKATVFIQITRGTMTDVSCYSEIAVNGSRHESIVASLMELIDLL